MRFEPAFTAFKRSVTTALGAIREPVCYVMAFLMVAGWVSFPAEAFSQGISISTTGIAPDASAGLDVDFTTKGMLIPRMTTAQRNAINGGTFADALFIFNTDDKCLQIYNSANTQWENAYCFLSCSSAPSQPGTISGSGSVCENATGQSYYIVQVAGATSYAWTVPTGASITAGQGTTGIVVTFGTTSGNITVTASNNCGTSTAQTLAIAVTTAPAITVQPTNQIFATGGNATFSLTATGGGLTYQWQEDTGGGFINISNGGSNPAYSNATTNSLTLTNIPVGYDTYQYRCVLTGCSNLNSSAASLDLCGGSFVDVRDGNSYNTLLIGTQCWMKENLAWLPSVVGPATGSTSIAYYYVYGYNGTDVPTAKGTANYTTYGVLYNGTAAMQGAGSSSADPSGVQGACPTGWHLPSDIEWCNMENTVEAGADPTCSIMGYRGVNGGGFLREAGTTHWNSPNTGATNSTGFTWLGAGSRDNGGVFQNIKVNGILWSTTTSIVHHTVTTSAQFGRSTLTSTYGLSVRCIRD